MRAKLRAILPNNEADALRVTPTPASGRQENPMFVTRVAPGCHSGPDRLGRIISRHRSWEAALNAASRNDRLVACDEDTGREAQILRQNDPRYGAGRYGNGLSGASRTAWVRSQT